MSGFAAAVKYVVDMGPSVMMPIIIFILGLLLRQSPGKALRSGLTVGFGFVGINLIIGLFFQYMSPAAEAMVHRFDLHLTALDVGWPAGAAIAFGTQIGALIFIIGILTNLVLLFTRFTKTLDIDIWNYWHWAMAGSLVYYATNSFLFGVIASILSCAFTLKMADWTAPRIQEEFDLPGISISQGFAMATVPIVWPLAWLVDRIPGLNNIQADPETIKDKLGVIGQPTVLGTVLGILIGILAGQAVPQILQMGVAMGAVFLLLPRVVAILMEGLTPLAADAKTFLEKYSKGRQVYIGMDSALLIGHPTTLATGLLLVPITVLLAIILPGNRLLPFGDLAGTTFFAVMITPFTRGNLVKSVIVGTVLMTIIMYMGSDWAPLVTEAATHAGFKFPANATMITNFGNPIAWLLVRIFSLFR
jgi:PTS system galactitol-specific IIC component